MASNHAESHTDHVDKAAEQEKSMQCSITFVGVMQRRHNYSHESQQPLSEHDAQKLSAACGPNVTQEKIIAAEKQQEQELQDMRRKHPEIFK